MTPATPGIPDPPRPIRWRPCLAHRWILGVLGTALTGLGAVLLALVFASGKGGPWLADTKLDSGASVVAGTIDVVESYGGDAARIEFHFQPPGGLARKGESFTTDKTGFLPRESVDVEYWADDPRINRIAGTDALHLDPELSTLSKVFLVLGLIGLLVWFRSAMKLRFTLRDGRLVEAQVIELKELLYVNPSQLRVQYRFRDQDDHEIIHSHWLRHNSEFARHLLINKPRTLSVIHARDRPQTSQAVTAGDFFAEETGPGRPT